MLLQLIPYLTTAAALIAAYIAWVQFSTRKRSERFTNFSAAINQWQTLNLAVVADSDLLEIERQNHPFSELTIEDTKKMYFYFTILNIPRNALMALNTGHLDAPHANSYINNAANITYKDRDFIRKNNFPRGYPLLGKELEKRWKMIEQEGGLIEQTRLITPPRTFFQKALGLMRSNS